MGGRGSSSGGGGGGSPLSNFEDSIRYDSVEIAALFDENGNMVFKKSQGLKNGVSFTTEECDEMVDRVLTHNHPSGSTFSPDDLSTIVATGLRTIRAVHRDGDYSLTRQFEVDGYGPSTLFNFSSDYHDARSVFRSQNIDKIWASSNKDAAAATKCNKMLSDFSRQWLQNNAASYGFEYKEVYK